MSKIKVVVCDDLCHIREYFCELINERNDMEVVGTAATAKEAIEIVNTLLPDVVLMDIQMEDEYSGINATKEILGKYPDIKILVITIHEEDDYITEAYAAGAVDFIVKTHSKEEICEAIVNAYKGNKYIRPYATEKLLAEFSRMSKQQKSLLYVINIVSKLTESELAILKGIYAGKTQRQIAAERSVELGTVKFHVSNILRKFGSSSTKKVIKELEDLQIFEVFYKD